MLKIDQPIFTAEQSAKNPAVDSKIVQEALRMRLELEQLGVWEDKGSQVRNPYEIKPALKPREESRSRLITQNR